MLCENKELNENERKNTIKIHLGSPHDSHYKERKFAEL